MSLRPQVHRLIGCPSGAAAVEFAMVGLLLISLLLATLEFGRALFLYNQLALAADIATRHVLLDPPKTASDLESVEAAIRDSIAFGSGGFQVQVELPTEDGLMSMTLRQPLNLLVPTLLMNTPTITINRRISLP